MAGDIEMELMEVVEVEEVVILTTTIPWPCQSLLARANNILQFWEKIILDFVINHHLLKWVFTATTKYGEWKEELYH